MVPETLPAPTAAPTLEAPTQPVPTQPAVSEYILQYSDSRYYTEAELSGLSKKELELARNELYARRGRIFNRQDLRDYFNSKSWYYGTIAPDDFNDEIIFNQYEKKNRDTIVGLEK